MQCKVQSTECGVWSVEHKHLEWSVAKIAPAITVQFMRMMRMRVCKEVRKEVWFPSISLPYVQKYRGCSLFIDLFHT